MGLIYVTYPMSYFGDIYPPLKFNVSKFNLLYMGMISTIFIKESKPYGLMTLKALCHDIRHN